LVPNIFFSFHVPNLLNWRRRGPYARNARQLKKSRGWQSDSICWGTNKITLKVNFITDQPASFKGKIMEWITETAIGLILMIAAAAYALRIWWKAFKEIWWGE
jgi:hypothetical protein